MLFLFGTSRTRFLLRLAIGVVLIALGIALHMLLALLVGLLMLAMAGVQWFGRRGNNGGGQ